MLFAVVMVLLSLPLAFIVGLASQKGSICAVAAVQELLDHRRPRQGVAILACSAWVLAVTVPLAWLLPRSTLAVSLPVDLPLLAGAFAFGMGAAVNRGCAFSTVTRLGGGDLSYLAAAAGLAGGLGLLALWRGLAREVPAPERISVLAEPQPWSLLLVAALLAAGAALLVRLVRGRAWRNAWSRARWNPFAATAVIGVAGGTLYALHGPWMYTSLIPRALGQPVSPDGIPAWEVALLTAAVLAGATVSVRASGRFRLHFDPGRAAACFAGGLLMGGGAGLSYGGNDVLVLHALPSLALHALPAWLAVAAGAAIVLLSRRRLAARAARWRERRERRSPPAREGACAAPERPVQ